MALEDIIEQYSDPDRFKKVNKRLAIGAAVAAALSGVAKQNLVPGYMSGVERIQEQQQMQRALERQQFKDQMDMVEHQARMRHQEFAMKQAELEAQQRAEAREAWKEYTTGLIDAETKQQDMMIKQQEGAIKGLDKIAGAINKYTGDMVDVSGVTDFLKKKVGDYMGVRREEIKEAETLRPIAALGTPEAAGMVREELDVVSPREELLREREDIKFGLDIKGAEQSIAINEGTLRQQGYDEAAIGQYGGAYMDLVNNRGKFSKEWDPDLGAKALQDYNRDEEYRRSQEAYRHNLYKQGREEEGDTTFTGLEDMKSFTKMTGNEQAFALGYVRDLAKSSDEDSVVMFVNDQIKKGTSESMMRNILSSIFQDDSRDPMEKFYKSDDMNPYLMSKYPLVDEQGNPILTSDDVPLATNLGAAVKNEGLLMVPGGYKVPNELYRLYHSNPYGFLEYAKSSYGFMGPKPSADIGQQVEQSTGESDAIKNIEERIEETKREAATAPPGSKRKKNLEKKVGSLEKTKERDIERENIQNFRDNIGGLASTVKSKFGGGYIGDYSATADDIKKHRKKWYEGDMETRSYYYNIFNEKDELGNTVNLLDLTAQEWGYDNPDDVMSVVWEVLFNTVRRDKDRYMPKPGDKFK